MMSNNRKLSLRDVAIIENREKLSHNKGAENVERTLLVIGSKKSGKTNIINQLIEKDKGPTQPPSTYLLEYKYARQSGKNLTKDVCHIWELGNGTTFVSLLSVLAKPNQPISVILVLDLTSPETILETAETLLETAKSLFVKSVDKEEHPTKPLNANIEEDDKPHLQPYPVPLVIIGGKYDTFKNSEPAKKRITCQYLRCLAHIFQADLLFYSNNDNKLVKNVRDYLLEYAFGIPASKNKIITDYNEPLSIPAGCDSFTNIQGSPATSVNYSLNKYRNSMIAHFKQETNQEQLPDDPASDKNFLEPVIDNLYIQKTEEIKRIEEEKQRKAIAIESLQQVKQSKFN